MVLDIGGSTASNTAVALTGCTMTNNAATSSCYCMIGVIVNVSFALVSYAWLVDASASRVPIFVYLLHSKHVDSEI